MFDESVVLRGLNAEQRAAVTHQGGPLRVLAGPGTGKTTTLTSRVAWLVGTGVPADRILLLTFTRRAARQMLGRTDALLVTAGVAGGSGRVRGGTFHAVAHQVLRRHAARLGLAAGFGVIDPADAADVIDLVRQDLGLAVTTGSRFPRKATLLDVYSRVVNTGRPLGEVLAEQVPWAADRVDDIAAVCRGYVGRKQALGLLDFDDLLLHWRAAVVDEQVGRGLADAVDHLLVDEYQDVNALQVDVVRGLRAADPRLTVVGDDAQAIYGFRAADPRHILDFPDAFPGTTTVVLGLNYRSVQPILDLANAVASQAPEGFTAVLREAQQESGVREAQQESGVREAQQESGVREARRPVLWRCADEEAQSLAVCERVLAHREEGVALRQQAVIVRAAHHSSSLELELSARRIPYVKYGGLRFLEAAHVKDLLAAFRLADNPRDELAWFRLLQLLPGVGPASARRAVTALGLLDPNSGPDDDVLLRWPLACAELPRPAVAQADVLVAALSRAEPQTVAAQADRLRVAITPMIAAGYPDPLPRLADLDALVVAAGQAAWLSDVAADHALEPPRSTADLAGPPSVDEDWLVISTAHSAKGLEWEVVHLLNASDGTFPTDLALAGRSGLEEERRVFYVAITRPRAALHVYLPQRYHHRPGARDDRHSWSQPSRFLGPAALATLDQRSADHDDRTRAGAPGGRNGSRAPAVVDAAARVAAQIDALWR